MPKKYFATHISLPPGVPSVDVVHAFFWRVFEEYRWFKPVHFGRAALNEQLDPARINYDALVAYYAEYQTITVTARTDRDFFMIYPARSDTYPYIGMLTWDTSMTETRKPAWRAAHLKQVSELMRLFNSPLALAGPAEDYDSKTERLVPLPGGIGQEQVFTLRDYSEGLPGLVWRNFLGAPFVRLFGERLDSLPAGTRQDLGEDLVLVQPYELPSQAGTPEGTARERELIAHLGPECFYDHESHTPPSRRPELIPRH
ncbi:hypothetical protein P2318_32835 [Myxococcaceae bacterium GXIMD 01537]